MIFDNPTTLIGVNGTDLTRRIRADLGKGGLATLTSPGALAAVFDAESGYLHNDPASRTVYFGIYCLCELVDGTLLAGLGSKPMGTFDQGAVIVRVDSAGTATLDTKLGEDGVYEMRLHAGQVFVLGCEPNPISNPRIGNVYVRSTTGVWSKKSTLVGVSHILSQCWDDANTWYVGVYLVSTGTNLWRSVDEGATWTAATDVVYADYWIFDLAYFASKIYAIRQKAGESARLFTTLDQGASWVDTAQEVDALPRSVQFLGRLVCIGTTRTKTVTVDAGGTISSQDLPFTVNSSDYQYHVLHVYDDILYAVGTTGIWYSADLENWHLLHEITDAMTPCFWQKQDRLLISDRGGSAAIYYGQRFPGLLDLGMSLADRITTTTFAEHVDDSMLHPVQLNLSRAFHEIDEWYSLTVDGTNSIVIPTNTALQFEAKIVGLSFFDYNAWSYQIDGTIVNVEGTLTLLESTLTVRYESDATYAARALADDVNKQLLIQVGRSAGGGDDLMTIWKASISMLKMITGL